MENLRRRSSLRNIPPFSPLSGLCKAAVAALLGNQFLMSASLDDLPVVNYQELCSDSPSTHNRKNGFCFSIKFPSFKLAIASGAHAPERRKLESGMTSNAERRTYHYSGVAFPMPLALTMGKMRDVPGGG